MRRCFQNNAEQNERDKHLGGRNDMQLRFILATIVLMTTLDPLYAAGPTTRYSGEASPPDEPLSLWYRRGAEKWVEALAIGNGRLGGMVWGNPSQEKINL